MANNSNFDVKAFVNATLVTMIVGLFVASGYLKTVIDGFNSTSTDVAVSKNALLCPDPTLIPKATDNQSPPVTIDNIMWHVSVETQTSPQPEPAGVRFFQAIITPGGNFWCNYAWGDPAIRVGQNATLTAPQNNLVAPNGYHWLRGPDGSSVCSSAKRETCAFMSKKS